MTEQEFGIWTAYWRKHSLPFRRQELYLAQVAMLVAQSAGCENVTLQDFLFDPRQEQPQAVMTPEQIALMVGN